MERRGLRGENRCSFCGRPEDQVKRLIAGQGAFICDECVALCNDVLTADDPPSPGSGEKAQATRTRSWLRRKALWTGYEPVPDDAP
jgi:ATP-dependent Clp protease ATP-binding subunit ClpX